MKGCLVSVSENLFSEKLSTDFYDSMLGDIKTPSSMNRLERITLDNVIAILNHPEQLNRHIPMLPSMLICLLDAIKNPHADIFTFIDIIEKDPAFAAEVLKVANTAKYNRGDEEIIYLRSATSLLGIVGLLKIATTLLMADVIPCKPSDYKLYGRQIWVHSIQCATLCELIAKDEQKNQADGYFIGLIHDLGRIVVFNSLAETLGESFTSITPCSQPYKDLMTEMAIDMSYYIAQQWQLPSVYIEALNQQRASSRDGLGCLLYRANRLSENYLLFIKGNINKECHQQLQDELKINETIVDEFHQLASVIEESTL